VRAARPGLALLLAAPLAAGAQSFTPPVDAFTGPVVSGGRVVGLGGAYVGVGEGVVGVTVNPAAVAQRDARLDRPWNVDGVLTWFLPQGADLARLDLDNDGAPDGGLTGAGNLLAGGGGQVGRLGAAVVARLWLMETDAAGSTLRLGSENVSVALGWSGWRDALVVGGSVTAVVGALEWLPPGAETPSHRAEYRRAVLRGGLLWRPRGLPFRLGLAAAGGARAGPSEDAATFPAPVPEAFLFPWSVSVGAAFWLGPNARRVNEPPPVALALHPDWGAGPPWEESARSPVLISVQLDLIGPAPGAAGMASALGATPVPSGQQASLVPRAGAEWEPLPRWIRVRGGGYLEPSRTGGAARLHGALGMEGRIPFWPWDLQLGFTADVAPRYQNVSLSLGFWSDLAPPRPVALPAPAPREDARP
jgi:hypothetical protein